MSSLYIIIIRLPIKHCSSLTWSSSGSSPKVGMYLAHSTKTSNCCLMDSHRSPTVADFCSDKSVTATGAVIWRKWNFKFPCVSSVNSYIDIRKKRSCTYMIVTCWDSDSAWASIVMGGRSWESGMFLRELIRSLSFCTAKIKTIESTLLCVGKKRESNKCREETAQQGSKPISWFIIPKNFLKISIHGYWKFQGKNSDPEFKPWQQTMGQLIFRKIAIQAGSRLRSQTLTSGNPEQHVWITHD